MNDKKLTLSLIIPVHNEAHHIAACLDAVAAQMVMPDEVLVIDNNCTDDTIVIAKQYPFVRIITEPLQGLIPARNRGFNEAKSDVLARIDADAVLSIDWVQRAKEIFLDQKLMALSGYAVTDLLPLTHAFKSTLWSRVYFLSSDAFFGVRMLWGANMALRRSMWQKIRALTNTDDHAVHEDQDISLLIASMGGRVMRSKKLLIYTPGQTYLTWAKYWEYTLRRRNTRRLHARKKTLISPAAQRIGVPVRLFGYMVTMIPQGAFTTTSFILSVPGRFKRPS